MVDKEKITSTVQRMVGQVLEETYDTKIFDEIFCLSQYLQEPDDTSYKANNLPKFEAFSRTELKRTHRALTKRLLKEINHKKISFLRTMRLIHALMNADSYGPEVDFSQVTNSKVQFCLQVWNMEISNPLEFVHQLDKM